MSCSIQRTAFTIQQDLQETCGSLANPAEWLLVIIVFLTGLERNVEYCTQQ
jgi:hypothetical protein